MSRADPLAPFVFSTLHRYPERPTRDRYGPVSVRMTSVPASLRRWFVVHFVADMAAATPLFVAPTPLLRSLGWASVDPMIARMVAAALAGIGIESLLCRNDAIDVFRAMLRLKCIWSGAAVAAVALSVLQGAPLAAWVVLATFVMFAVVWNYYRVLLRDRPSQYPSSTSARRCS